MNLFPSNRLALLLTRSIKFFLILFPFQTIWIFEERLIGGSKWEYGTTGLFLNEILLWLIIVLFAVWYSSQIHWNTLKRPSIRSLFGSLDRRLALAALLFVLFVVASLISGEDSQLALQAARHILAALLFFFIILLSPIHIADLLNWLFVSGVIQSLIALFQFGFQSSPELTLFGMSAHRPEMIGASIVGGDAIGRVLRGYGSFPHPNMLGGFLSSLLVLFSLAAHRLCARSWITALTITMLFIGLFVSFSRGAWIALLVFILLFTFFVERREKNRGRSSRAFLIGLSVFALLVFIFFSLVATRFRGASPHEALSTSERIEGARTALAIIQENPLFGVGPGGYTVELKRRPPALSGWQIQPAHNAGLLFLSELGLLGTALFLFLLFSWGRFLFSSLPKEEWPFARRSLMIAGIFALFLGSVDHYLVSQPTGLFVGALFLGSFSRLMIEAKHKSP